MLITHVGPGLLTELSGIPQLKVSTKVVKVSARAAVTSRLSLGSICLQALGSLRTAGPSICLNSLPPGPSVGRLTYVSWLYMREQVEGKRQRGQDGRHGHLQTNLRRNTLPPLLCSPGEKRVTRSRPHARGGRHTGRESPGTRPGATRLPAVYRSVLEVR